MPGESQKITIQILNINRLVDNILAGIDQEQSAISMGGCGHLLNRRKPSPKTFDIPVTATNLVRGVNAFKILLQDSCRHPLSGISSTKNRFHHAAFATAQGWHGVRLEKSKLHPRVLKFTSPGRGHQIDGFRRIPGKNNFHRQNLR